VNLGMDGATLIGASDVDLYRLIPEKSQTLSIRADALQEEGADTFLRIFDDQGHEIAFNDNAAAQTAGSALILSAVAEKTYYIGVSGAGNGARSYDPIRGGG